MINSQYKAIALGSFDGLHLGHKKVISKTIELSKSKHISSLVFNIDKNTNKKLIQNDDKEEILKKIGVDLFYNIGLKEICHLDGYDFINEVIINRLKAKAICCGFNYRFGNNAKYDVNDLKDICSQKEVELYVVPPVFYQDILISSTKIRNFIEVGNICSANALLGYKFFINFNVCEEDVYDSSLIIKQILENDFIIPKAGTYQSTACIDKEYNCITKIINKNELVIAETKIFDYNKPNLINRKIKIEFLKNN